MSIRIVFLLHAGRHARQHGPALPGKGVAAAASTMGPRRGK